MKLRKMRGNIMLLIAAVIWGSAFVAQSEGMNYIGPFTYVFSRSIIGAAVLVIIIYAIRTVKKKNNEYHPADLKMSAWGGMCCGAVLFAAASFQQFGISNTTAGKAGFITTLYVIIVPVLGFFMKKKTPSRVWICAAVAVAGFYLLCIRNDFSIGSGDLLVLISAVFFSLHIIVIDYFNKRNTDPMIMSCFQFLTAGIIGFPVMIIHTGSQSAMTRKDCVYMRQRERTDCVTTLAHQKSLILNLLTGYLQISMRGKIQLP